MQAAAEQEQAARDSDLAYDQQASLEEPTEKSTEEQIAVELQAWQTAMDEKLTEVQIAVKLQALQTARAREQAARDLVSANDRQAPNWVLCTAPELVDC